MTTTARGTTITTLQDHLDNGYGLTVYCSVDCNQSKELDLEALIARFGPDFRISAHHAWFLRQFTCTKCGRKAVQVIRSTHAGTKAK